MTPETESPSSDRETNNPDMPKSTLDPEILPTSNVGPLRVGLDIRFWKMSGLGTYVRELLGAFGRVDLPVQWTLVGPAEDLDELPSELTVEKWIPLDRPVYSAMNLVRYPSVGSLDVFHYPHYNMPRIGISSRRRLVTVFDLFHMRYGSWLKRSYQAHFMRRLRWSHAHVATASVRTARDLTEWGGIPAGRISIVPLGPGKKPQATGQEPTAGMVRSLSGTPLSPPWLLVTGIDQPHKNFDFMLSALALYFQQRPDSPPLVWLGLNEETRIRRGRQLPAQLRQRICLEPYADPDRLETIYRGARALIFPSLDEGFGLPPLEAMTRGVPVLCSRREPMLGILGKAALYFEPTESTSFWRALDRLLDMKRPALNQLIAAGRTCARAYDWERTARETFRLYAWLAGRNDLMIGSLATTENALTPEE